MKGQSQAFGFIVISIFVVTPFARAATLAFDSAADPAYNDGWQNGDNGGTGWGGGWTMFASPTSTFIGDSTANGDALDNGAIGGMPGDGDINTAGRAWGLNSTGGMLEAERNLNGVLTTGQSIEWDIDTGL